MSAKSSSRGGSPVTLIAVHTNEGDNPAFETTDHRAENLAAWMDGQPVSYHKIVDDDSVVNYVPDVRMSWALRSGNSRSLNVCFIGRAAWTRGEWLQHDRMLRMGGDIVRNWSIIHGIPARKLTPEQVNRDQRGVIGHWDWTIGKRDGSHTDPGPGFPWDLFMRYVNAQTPEGDDDVTTIPEIRKLLEEHAQRKDDLSPSRRVDTGYARDQAHDDVMELARNLVVKFASLETALANIKTQLDELLTPPKE